MTRRRRGPSRRPGRHVRTVRALRRPVPAALALLCSMVWALVCVALVVTW